MSIHRTRFLFLLLSVLAVFGLNSTIISFVYRVRDSYLFNGLITLGLGLGLEIGAIGYSFGESSPDVGCSAIAHRLV